MPDEYGFKAPISNALGEQAERFRAEVATGVGAEREEEILVRFAYHEKRLACGRQAKAIGNHLPVEFLRPRFLN